MILYNTIILYDISLLHCMVLKKPQNTIILKRTILVLFYFYFF